MRRANEPPRDVRGNAPHNAGREREPAHPRGNPRDPREAREARDPREAREYTEPTDPRSPERLMEDARPQNNYPGDDSRADPGTRRIPREQQARGMEFQQPAPPFADRDANHPRHPGRNFAPEDSPMEDYHPREPAGRGQNYFLPSDGISHEVLQADICRYLGNNATVRRTERQGVAGYLINAYRMLTDTMIDDLMSDTKRFENEQRRFDADQRHVRGRAALAYDDSATYRGHQFQEQQGRHGQYGDDFERPPSREPHGGNPARDYPPQPYPPTNPYQNPQDGRGGGGQYVAQPGPPGSGYEIPRHQPFPTPVNPGGRGLPQMAPANPYPLQQGNPPLAPYRDPATGQVVYPSASHGRGVFDPNAQYREPRRQR